MYRQLQRVKSEEESALSSEIEASITNAAEQVHEVNIEQQDARASESEAAPSYLQHVGAKSEARAPVPAKTESSSAVSTEAKDATVEHQSELSEAIVDEVKFLQALTSMVREPSDCASMVDFQSMADFPQSGLSNVASYLPKSTHILFAALLSASYLQQARAKGEEQASVAANAEPSTTAEDTKAGQQSELSDATELDAENQRLLTALRTMVHASESEAALSYLDCRPLM